MRTRGERRRLTARAIKRKWDVYWDDQRSSTTKGQRWSYWRRCWVDAHYWQRTPHRYNKKSILGTTVRWDGRRHNLDWDAPEVSEWDGWDEPLCTLGTKWG